MEKEFGVIPVRKKRDLESGGRGEGGRKRAMKEEEYEDIKARRVPEGGEKVEGEERGGGKGGNRLAG